MGGTNSKGQEKTLCVQLHNAIVGGNESVARELLLCGAVSPNNRLFVHSRKLVLPLFTAIENNCLSLVEVLLQYDASTSAFNREGNTPLHMAASLNFIEVAETLIRHQADPCALNAHGDTALHIAATYGFVNMAALLIRSGASANIHGKQQRTPLHSACAIPGNTNMIMALLDNGVDPDTLDEDRRAPLHYLAQRGNTGGIDVLLQAGASKNIADAKGKTALHITVEHKEVQTTIVLLRHQCDINWQDCEGQTPLHKAVDKECGELVSLLLQNGADSNISNSAGRYPLHSAVFKKNVDIAQKLILNGSANVNARDRSGITPLHVACLYGLKDNEQDRDAIELLLNNGADVNERCTKYGRTSLHRAVEAKNDEAVVMLLRQGADATIVDAKGKTAADLSTVQAISNILLNSTSFSSHVNQPNGSSRPTNLYTPPTVRSNRVNQNPFIENGVGNPPPLPPRDNISIIGQVPNMNGLMGATTTLQSFSHPPTNVLRREFMWSSLEDNSNSSPNTNSESLQVKVDVTASSTLLTFPTTFGGDKSGPQTLCYSILRSGQLINTKLGCLLNIEHGAVKSNLLLYVDAMSYSPKILQLPKSCRLCSNIIHFYTHCLMDNIHECAIPAQRDIHPEKEVPHFLKQVLVEFPLRKSAINLFDERENEIKILVSYDEGSTWDETPSRIEKVYMEKNSVSQDFVHLVVTETDELGMYAVVLCPKQDVKKITSSGEKVASSVDPSLTVSADTEGCIVEMTAENTSLTTVETLQTEDFPYVVGCSRKLSLHLTNPSSSSSTSCSMSVHLPCHMLGSNHGSDISYRVLKKSEELLGRGWCAVSQGVWEDITQKECKQLQVSGKSKRLLGATTSHSPHHVSFTVPLNGALQTSFIALALRSFSPSLTNHLLKVPNKIERIQSNTGLCFMIHQKVTRPSAVTCDIVQSKDAESVDKMYRESSSYQGPSPSSSQVVHERDCISISSSGGIKANGGVARNIIFNSALLPLSERFNIKGANSPSNTSEKYFGAFEFVLNPETCGTGTSDHRPPLSSESSVLVMENRAFSERTSSQSSSVQEHGKNLLASLLIKLPRKRMKSPPSSTNNVILDKSQLSDEVLHFICRGLDKAEFKELAFQLDVSKHKFEDIFSQSDVDTESAGVKMLQQWSAEKHAFNQDAIPSLCDALRCIGRENLSQDVAQRCNQFLLDDVKELAPLPELSLDTVVPTFPDSFVNESTVEECPSVSGVHGTSNPLSGEARP